MSRADVFWWMWVVEVLVVAEERLRTKWGGRWIAARPDIDRWLRRTTTLALTAMTGTTLVCVIWPMAVHGVVRCVEPSALIRWVEFGVFVSLTVLGLIQTVLSFRKEKEEK